MDKEEAIVYAKLCKEWISKCDKEMRSRCPAAFLFDALVTLVELLENKKNG